MDPISATTLAHYRLLERVGEGGMGVVYRARDTRLDRDVAVKVLRPELTADPHRKRRFLMEARAAAAVSHPGIATIHEIDEAGGVTFIVMELLAGRTLRSLIEEGSLGLDEALDIAAQVASAMARAHEARVIHRDLKPDNIVVGPDGHAKILDFGLARRLDSAEPRAAGPDTEDVITQEIEVNAGIEGTVAYMSPEQARGEALDPRTDVFSFGVILYEMLAGRRPFVERTVTSTIAKILESDPEPLVRLRPELPEKVARVIDRCLKKDRAERYEDGARLVEALAAARAGASIDDRPVEVSASTIAVFPFTVRGGRDLAHLGAGMVDLLSTKLDGAGELRSVDPHVILCCDALETSASSSDPAAAASLARRFGAGMFVLGTLVEAAGRLHIEASLYETDPSPRVVSRSDLQGGTGEIFDLVDRLTARLLANRCTGPGARLDRLAAVTTDSYPALKSYLEGEGEMRAMRRLRAVEAYGRAVAIDPSFALAWYRLSVAALWSGRSTRAIEAAKRAVEHARRLSDRDRSLLEAFEASLSGDNDEAERRYRSIVGSHPDDVEAWYQLGEVLFHCGPPRGRPITLSRQAWERLLALDPGHVNGHAHLAVVAACQGDREEAHHAVSRVLELSPAGDLGAAMRSFWAFHTGDPAAREAVLDELRQASDHSIAHALQFVASYLGDQAGGLEIAHLMCEPVRSPEVRVAGRLFAASLEAARGRWDAARAELRAAGSADRAAAARHRALLDLSPWIETPAAELTEILAELDRLEEPEPPGPSPWRAWLAPHEGLHAPIRLYLMGRIEARLGHGDAARSIAARLEASSGSPASGSLVHDLSLGVRSAAAQAEGRLEEALDLLQSVRRRARFDLVIWSPIHAQALERFSLADLLGAAGRVEEAIAWYSSFAVSSIGDQVHVAPAHLKRAEIFEKLGRPDAAGRHYARFLDLWKDADPRFGPLLDQARDAMARLE